MIPPIKIFKMLFLQEEKKLTLTIKMEKYLFIETFGFLTTQYSNKMSSPFW